MSNKSNWNSSIRNLIYKLLCVCVYVFSVCKIANVHLNWKVEEEECLGVCVCVYV